MKDILFLAHRIPYPPDRGDKIRSWNLLRYLAGFRRVHLACFADDEADAAHLPSLRKALGPALGETCVVVRRTSRPKALASALASGRPVSLTAFGSARLRRFVEERIASPDIGAVVAFSSQMAPFVPDIPGKPFLMDFGDMDSAKFAAYADQAMPPLKQLYRREQRLLLRHEVATAHRADAVTFVSEAEAQLFRTTTGAANVHAVSNGIDLAYFDPGASFLPLPEQTRGPAPLLVFTGQMDYPPNVDAVRWFARDVLPLIPDVRLAVVGRDPGAAVRALAGSRVVVTGAVPDVRPWLVAADVIVAPLRIARGIQNKVLEAMAMTRPVVATSAAFEGIDAEPGRDLIVADAPEDMARKILMILGDKEAATDVAAAARRQVERHYVWEARLAPLAKLLELEPTRIAA